MSKMDLTPYRVRRPEWKSALVVTAHVALVVSPVYLAAAVEPGWPTVVFWLWFGLLGHGLTNLMHEAAHRLVFRSRHANDRLGDWLLAPLFLTDFARYRERHWQHHRRVGEDDDTKDAYLVPIRGLRVGALIAGCLLLINAAGLLFKGAGSESIRHRAPFRLLPLAVFQSLFLASLVGVALSTSGGNLALAAPKTAVAYGFVYLYGTASLTVFIATLRAVSEHQIGPVGGTVTGRAALRNLRSAPLTRLVFGCYGFAEHASHHEEPSIPYYRLPAFTEILAERDDALRPVHGYMATLMGLTGSEAATTAEKSGFRE